MTLIDTQRPSAADIFLDAQGKLLLPPAKVTTTTVARVGGPLAHPNRDMGMSSLTAKVQPQNCILVDALNGSISCSMVLPVQYGEETGEGCHCLLPHELDMVCGYMSDLMHHGVPSKGEPATS